MALLLFRRVGKAVGAMSLARAREACRIYLKDELPLDKDPREVIQRFRVSPW